MEMRKFIIEIHSDGRVTCCEYEDHRDVIRSAWLAGYKRAVTYCDERNAQMEVIIDDR